jgi:hypothetical protein
MSAGHPEIGPELRQLAQAILDRLDPALRGLGALAGEGRGGPGRCQQAWCPVCALAALITGEQHPLLAVVAEHSAALTAMIRAMLADPPGSAQPEAPGKPGRYEHIPIVVEPDVPVPGEHDEHEHEHDEHDEHDELNLSAAAPRD